MEKPNELLMWTINKGIRDSSWIRGFAVGIAEANREGRRWSINRELDRRRELC